MTFFTSRAQAVAASALLVVAVVAGPAVAQDRGVPARTIGPQGARDGGRSLGEAIRHVQRSTGGQILGVERVQADGRNINRVKYFDDRGRVRYMDDPGERMRPQRDVDATMRQPPRDDNP